MKISSASKKVLASALSAAMVVAFAPTVALADKALDPSGKKVTVSYSAGTGSVKAGMSNFTTDDVALNYEGDKFYIQPKANNGVDSATAANTYAKGSYSFSKWWYDADADGVVDDGETVAATNGWLEVSGDTTAVALTALYAEPAVSEVTNFSFGISDEGSQTKPALSDTLPTFKVSNLPNGDYTADLKLGDKVVYEKTSTTTQGEASSTDFALSPASGLKDSDLKAGTYTLTVYKAGTAVLSEEYKVHTLTLDCGSYGSFADGKTKTFLVSDGTSFSGLTVGLNTEANKPTAASQQASGYTFQKWTSDVEKITSDVTLTASYNNAKVSKVEFKKDALVFSVANIENYSDVDKVSFAVSGAASISGELTQNSGKIDNAAVCFGQKAEGQVGENVYYTKAAAAAGTYKVAVTVTYKASAAKDPVVLEGEVSVGAVTYDLGTCAWKANTDEAQASLVKLVQVGDNITTAYNKANSVLTDTYLDVAGEDDGITGITVNGKAFSKLTDAEKEMTAAGATIAVVTSTVKVAKPTYTQVVNPDGTVTLTFTAAEGTKLTYAIDSTDKGNLNGPVTLKPADAARITVTATDTATKAAKQSNSVTLIKAASDVSSRGLQYNDTFINDVTGAATSQSTALAPQTYGSVQSVKDAAEAGSDSIAALGYTTQKEVNAANLKAAEDLLKAAADVEVANLDALKAGIANSDGSVTKVGDEVYGNAVKAVEAVLADFDKNHDYKADGTTQDTSTASKAQYASTAAYLTAIKAAYSAAVTAATTYAKADVDAAAAVTTQLEAAKDATAAKAAIEAYNALTDTQKALVSADALKAAHAIVDAQTVVDGQDQAAVNYCNSVKKKTVKLAKKAKKTKKKFSVKWNSQVSESGNKVTYAKKSGSAKVTVSANGKATLKKGVKKGTYKAKVKVSCGNATRTVTAKFIVK